MKRAWVFWALLFLGACSVADTNHLPQTFLSPFSARLSQIIAFAEGRVSAVDGGAIADSSPINTGPLAVNWRKAEANLFLDQAGPIGHGGEFLFPGLGAYSTRITFKSLAAQDMDMRLTCDAPARLYGAMGQAWQLRAGRAHRFALPKGRHANVYLQVDAKVNTCNLTWGAGRSLRLRRESLARPSLNQIDRAEHHCTSPDPANLDALQAAFYTDRWLTQTCAAAIGPAPVLLDDPQDALNARIKALTGATLSRAQLLAGDPDVALDYSNAPKLDLIYVSYLLMRADYTGYLMKRMLAYHASRGSVVRILLTGKLMLKQDRALFESLAAAHPSVQLQYFAWDRPGLKTPMDAINAIQRAHHIKMFATLSSELGRSRVILGGRNLWDGFFFNHPIDLSAHPELHTYDENGSQMVMYYSVYKDFEVMLQGDQIVRDLMAHMSSFWHRDQRLQVARPMAVPTAFGGHAQDGQTRHFMSLPWADAQAQEAYFVELFDAAENEITIVTPFIYPTPTILNSLLRARARGVKVVIVARITSTDPSGVLVTALNHGFVTGFAGDFEVYDFTPEHGMLHTKMILIDGRLSMVTSSNLNRRSFLHDTENGVVFLDRKVTARLQGIVDGYLRAAKRMHPGGDLAPVDRLINQLTDIWQFL